MSWIPSRKFHHVLLLMWLCLHCIHAKDDPTRVEIPSEVRIAPDSVSLRSPLQTLQLVVTGVYPDGTVRDLTRVANYRFDDPLAGSIEQGLISPKTNAKTSLKIDVASLTKTIPVQFSHQDAQERIPFLTGTLAALSKNGCNSGGCHGAPSGKGGFALSMVAFDPESDKNTLTRDMFSRRINPTEPESSLLLRKPLMKTAHRGGLKLSTDDEAYRILLEWIQQGCQFDSPETPKVTHITIGPENRRTLHAPANTQQLRVAASFNDGSSRDITRLAMYSSSDDATATVDTNGLVTALRRGQAAISVRFLDQVETFNLTFIDHVPGFEWHSPQPNNFIDEKVFTLLERLHVPPSDTTSDSEFIRRVHLDVTGLLPASQDTEAFLADTNPKKRAALIDRLLDSPQFARFWAFRWGDVLRISPTTVSEPGTHKYNEWLVESWERNLPYDQFAKSLLTAQGSTLENPPANFFRTTANTSEATEMTAQIFLGARIQCAKCHNHPFERWTQDNYYGLAAFFERIQRRKGNRSNEMFIFSARRGEITQPRTNRLMSPWLPGQGTPNIAPETDRITTFADWLTNPDNPYFARVEANRIWSQLTGRGIVEPIDDFRDSNPPSNPDLLDALAEHFVRSGFDRKQLIRTILNSATYQRSSRALDLNRDDERLFSHARRQLLSAEQLLDAVCQITGQPERFGSLPQGTPATQLPAPQPSNLFLVAFGQPARQTSCACERQSQPSLTQALQLANSQTVENRIKSGDSIFIKKLLGEKSSDEDIINTLYLAALCRKPSESERHQTLTYLRSKPDKADAMADVVWSILNLREFIFRQ
jgi:hypothetical protein